MGPAWDFDLAAGNRASQYSPEYLYVGIANYWYRNLLDMPEFFAAVTDRWNEIKDWEIKQMITLVGDTALFYKTDFERNFERHPIIGTGFWNTPPAMLEIGDFMGQVDYLIGWFNTRVAWLDDFFNGGYEGHHPLWHLIMWRTEGNPYPLYREGMIVDLWPPVFHLHNVFMIELHTMADAFGLGIYYDPQTQTVEITGDTIKITHRVYGADYTVNGEENRFDASSFMIGDYIFVPIEPMLAALAIPAEVNPTRENP
jgi:hypothetical protein